MVVVGGGPGGLYLAWLLAREGFDVAVAEEHGVVGLPVHCTGVLAAEAFDEFEIPRATILNALTHVRFYGPSGDSFDYTTKNVETVVVDRKSFDDQLACQAEQAGARLLSGCKATGVEIDEAGVLVQIENGEDVPARVAVLACGANYGFQRRLGLGVPSVHLQTAQVELPASQPGDVELYFGVEVAPKGFAWAVPVRRREGPHARVGLMCDRNASLYFDRFFQKIAPRWGLDSSASMHPRRKILPLGPIRRTYADRLLAIGDAAGLVKPTTGGGIYYSVASAAMAAEVLSEGLRRDQLNAHFLEGYQKLWQQRLGSELRAQLTLRTLTQSLTDREIDRLFELAKTDGLLPLVRRTVRFNQHRHLILELLKHPQAGRILLRRFVG